MSVRIQLAGFSNQKSPTGLGARAPLPGRAHDVDLTRSVANIVGWELRRAEVNLNFVPDATRRVFVNGARS